METPRLDLGPPELWKKLRGHMWHATSFKSAREIVASAAIRHDMNRDGFKNGYCRVNGGVSLFDFSDTEERIADQSHNWQSWLGHQRYIRGRAVVWFRINREAVRDSVKSVADTGAAWHAGGHHANKYIPYVEVCHAGSIPLSAIDGSLVISSANNALFEWVPPGDAMLAEIVRLETTMPELPPPGPLELALEQVTRDLIEGRKP